MFLYNVNIRSSAVSKYWSFLCQLEKSSQLLAQSMVYLNTKMPRMIVIMHVITIYSNLDQVLLQMRKIRASLDPFSSDLELTIDFDYERFVNPIVLGVIASFVERLRLKFEVNVNCTNMHPDNRDYVARMNFFRDVGYPYLELFQRHDDTGRFIPITRLTEESQSGIPSKVIQMLERHWEGIDRSILACLDWTIAEVTDNVINHSKSKIDGFVIGQSYPKKNRISFAVIDCGIGIGNRLRERDIYSDLSDEDALRYAVDEDVTVNPLTNGGVGLYRTRRIVEQNGGRLIITSGSGRLVADGKGKAVTKVPKWPGTIVHLEINTDRVIDPDIIWGSNIPANVLDYIIDAHLW